LDESRPRYNRYNIFKDASIIIFSILVVFTLLHFSGMDSSGGMTGYSVINETGNATNLTNATGSTDNETIDDVNISLDTTNITLNETLNITNITNISNLTGISNLTNITNITINVSQEISQELSITLISPADSSFTPERVNLSYGLEGNASVDTCGLYFLYRYLQDEFWLAAEKTSPPMGSNHFEALDLQPGEYLWKISCSGAFGEWSSDVQSFTAVANISNLTLNVSVELNLTNVSVNLSNVTELQSELIQGSARVGSPVNWTRRILLNRTGEFVVRTFVPYQASGIEVYETPLVSEQQEGPAMAAAAVPARSRVGEDKVAFGRGVFLKLEGSRVTVQRIESPTPMSVYSAFPKKTGKGLVQRFLDWLSSLFGITGAAALEPHPVELLSPSDNETGGRNFNLLYQTDREFDQCLLYLDSTVNQTDILVLEGLNFFQVTGLQPGEHSWNVVCELDHESLYSPQWSFFSAETVEGIIQDGTGLVNETLNLSEENVLYSLPESSGSYIEMNITENLTVPKVYEISYQTPGPEKSETEHSQYLKSVVISGEIGYSNVTAYTDVPWVPEWLVKLNWRHNDSSVEAVENLTLIDSNNDSLVDRIEWLVPHLSGQEYDLDLSYDIPQLNLTSAERLGDNFSSEEDVTALLLEEDSNFTTISSRGLRLGFGSDLSDNDTISVYAWAAHSAPIHLMEDGTDRVLSMLTLKEGEWFWYNFTIAGFNASAGAFVLEAEGVVMYDYATAYDKMLIIPKRVHDLQANASVVIAGNESIDLTEVRQFGTEAVILKDEAGNRVSSFEVYFGNAESDIDLSGITVESSSAERKSAIDVRDQSELVSMYKTIFIPSTGEGLAYICPYAKSVEDVNDSCQGMFYVYPGENLVNVTRTDEDNSTVTETITITMEEVDIAGIRMYRVEGITGTGGGEAIRIINTHSYPSLGANWTVIFTTKGTANLTITPVMNTTFSEFIMDDNTTEDDLLFVELRCGSGYLHDRLKLMGVDGASYSYSDLDENSSMVISSLFIEDYSCEGTGFLTDTELSGGHHALLFEFGDQYAMAENYVSQLYCNITPLCLYTDVFHLSSMFNAHAELNSNSDYEYIACCREIYGEIVGTDCAAPDAEPILRLESETNSHVEKVSESTYPYEICLSGTDNYNITCAYDSDCSAYETCVASVSSTEIGLDTNLQVGNCTGSGSYTTKICCDTEVESTCVTPYDDYTVTQDVTFCSGIYYLNDSAGEGLIKFGADSVTATCNDTTIIGNSSGYGFYSNGKANITVEGCVVKNYTRGIFLNSTSNSTFLNNSLFNNTYGAYLLNSTGNVLHHNNFTDSTAYHAYSDRGENHFNTTFAGAAQGNWWDDVAGLKIYDTNLDGYGDFGLQYPYNSSFSSKVSVNVTDWGPITGKSCADDDSDGYGAQGSNITSCTYSQYADCDDNNASVIPPRDELNFTSDTWLCNGTYYLNDTAGNGLVNFKASHINLTCNKTLIVGNNAGRAFSAESFTNMTLNSCNASNYTYGIYMDSTSGSTVRNNSVSNTTYGAYLTGGATGNLFYYNEFRNSSTYHAFAGTAGNQFNTTSGSVAHGNYWGGVESLKIYDTQDDGFGDAGLQYPYNSSNGGNVSSNVADWGPITSRTDYLILPPIPLQPIAEEVITDSRNPVYGWSNPEHTLSDSVTYNIEVDDNSDFGSPVLQDAGISEGVISTYYWNSSWLQFSTTYYWRVRANDTYNVSDWSAVYNFSILPTTSCTQPSDEMDFGNMCVNPNQTICDQKGWGSHINDTLDNHPPPYSFENDGNLKSKGKVYSSTLWVRPKIVWDGPSYTLIPMPNELYQCMIGVNESGSYDWALDSSWVNMTNTSQSALEAFYGFKWQNVSDAVNLHIRLESPVDEPPGVKYSTTYIECEQNETY